MLPDLAAAVGTKSGHVTATSENGFEFGSSLMQWSLQLLCAVSWGSIELREAEGEHELTYRLSLFRVRFVCLIFTFAAPVFLLGDLGEGAPPPWLAVPACIAVIWGWIYGMNWLLTATRFRSFIERVIHSAQDAQRASAPPPERADP